MALTKTAGEICDWTACAASTSMVGGQLSVSDAYETTIIIQAFQDQDNVAHAGTEFIVQGRANTGDTNEDWYDITRFVELSGSVTSQNMSLDGDIATNDASPPLNENPTTMFTVGNTDTPLQWGGIEDANTLTASEMVCVWKSDADEVFLLTSNEAGDEYLESAKDTDDIISYKAFSRGVVVGIGHYRIRVIVHNMYDVNGASINFRLRYIKVTGV